MKTSYLVLCSLGVALLTAFACGPTYRPNNDDDDGDDESNLTVGSATTSSASASGGAGGAGASTVSAGGATTGVASTGTTSGATSGTGTTAGSGSGSTSTGGPMDVCGSGLTTGTDALDQCITDSCCTSFTPCINDVACYNCLLNQGDNCDNNTLYTNYFTCSDSACPGDICGSGVGFDGAFDCNSCGDTYCCADIGTCIQGGTQTEVSNCIDCLNDPASAACAAHAAVVGTSATAFNACLESNCPIECGL